MHIQYCIHLELPSHPILDKIAQIRSALNSNLDADPIEVTGSEFCMVIWEEFEPLKK